jgi:ribonuclease E
MTVVDVNTGKFTGAGGNLEQTVTKNNLEAAEEIVRQLRLRDIGGIVVIDFIDMVLESNRDLVLRRLTEALARDRTRHQVSEVTSLGLVQLTRKKLGTGLIEAFSSTCSHCSGRGIMVHAEPVDHAPSNGRKSESTGGGRRNRRGRKGRGEDAVAATAEVVARVPAHVPGEHPMFKAMAAAKNGDEESDEESEDFDADLLVGEDDETGSAGIELVGDLDEDDDDLDDDDDDDDDDDEDDEDDEDDDEDVDDDDLDDDDDEDDEDDDLDDDDEDDDLDDDLDDDDEDEDDLGEEVQAPASAPTARVRRRTAARPAGPPAV